MSHLPHFRSKRSFILGSMAICAFALSACATSGQDLYAQFRAPKADARPFVRWWWNGARVNESEILRELDVMKAAGIGGVEINTIAMPQGASPASLAKFPELQWLGPQWTQMVKVAVAGARARDMTADLIVGSGWPFGGRFLKVKEQTQRVRLVKREIIGPRTVELSRQELARPVVEIGRNGTDEVPPTRTELVFLRLISAANQAESFSPGEDLMPTVQGEQVRIRIPEGRHAIYAGFRDWGFTHVKLGAPGADGPVVNHFDAKAVSHYLDQLASKLSPALGGKLGNGLRALFIDSLELDHANWTDDFETEFERRRGYALAPYLPFVLDAHVAGDTSPFQATVRRARYDFSATLVELFEERFLATFVKFCEDNGVLARVQAYGRETHPLAGGMQVHLPEGETWLWHDQDHQNRIRVESTTVNKYVSSAAHLVGQPRVSFEAMTSAVAVFRETLSNFKQGMDLSLLAGLNHPILHGFNYTPPEAGFPGWVRFGTYLNERNPWWPAFSHFSDYAARMGTVLRASAPQAQVAVLAPRADEWAIHGLLYQPFPEVHHPWYQYRLTAALSQAGYGNDFVSERIIQKANVDGGQLRYGPQSYALVIVEDAESLQPATAEALAKFAQAGGRVLFVGQTPSHAPGLAAAQKNDAAVVDAVKRLMPLARVAPNPNPSLGDEGLVAWVAEHVPPTGVRGSVALEAPRSTVSQIHHRAPEGDVFFFANTDTETPATFTAGFAQVKGQPWRWDPATGHRQPYPHVSGTDLRIHLEPQASLLLVFQKDGGSTTPSPATAWPLAGDPAALSPWQPLNGPWQADFRPANAGAPFARSLGKLVDLSVQDDPALSTFGGVVTYTTNFTAPASGRLVLDLGEVHSASQVEVNGQNLGMRWWGRHRYDMSGALKAGTNSVSIKVFTVLANLMKAKKDDPMAQRWASWFKPIPTGLVGPVLVSEPVSETQPFRAR